MSCSTCMLKTGSSEDLAGVCSKIGRTLGGGFATTRDDLEKFGVESRLAVPR